MGTPFLFTSLSLTGADVCKHVPVDCVQPSELKAPLQLVDGPLLSEQSDDSDAFAHIMGIGKKKTEHKYA